MNGYEWLVVFQGGKRDGCTELCGDEPESKDYPGYTEFQISSLNDPSLNAIRIKVMRPWSPRDSAPSYL